MKMGTRNKKVTRRKSSSTKMREQTQCRFCRNKKKYIDYKDVVTLDRLLTNRGKI